MKLKNVLIVTGDIEKSKRFYRDLFGLQVILEQEGNVMLTEGLVLQDAGIWKQAVGPDIKPRNNMTALYFEESAIEAVEEKLRSWEEDIVFVNRLEEFPWGQKMMRFYDPDGNLIELRTPIPR